MSKLSDKIRAYFFIPPAARLEISKKNVRLTGFLTWGLLFLGLTGFFIEARVYHQVRLFAIIYYSLFVIVSLLFLILSHFSRKKDSYALNQALLILICTFVAFLMYYGVYTSLSISHVISFYFAIFLMILLLEITPVFYALIIAAFFILVLCIDLKTPGVDPVLHLNNGLFCLVLIFFSFFKRKITSIRELNKVEIEEKNRQLSMQNIELNRQKDSLLINKQYLEDAVFSQSQEIQLQKERLISIQNNTIVSLSNLVENRDEDTGEHVLRTRDYVQLIAAKAFLSGKFPELNEDMVELFYKAAPMHDIGKIVVPDAVLKKPGKLTAEEFELIKQHTVKGGEIVEDVLGAAEDAEYVKVTKDIATSHHEKVDGTGYPYGLKWDEIPLSARIMAIADVFDALVSPRCYKEPIPLEQAFGIIAEGSGNHFDPELVKMFLDSKDEVVAIFNKYQNYKKTEK